MPEQKELRSERIYSKSRKTVYKSDLQKNAQRKKETSIYEIKSNFYYTRCVMPQRVTSCRGPSPLNFARATQLLSKKCCSGASRWQHCVRFDRPEF